MRRMLVAVGLGIVVVLAGAGPALACGGLIGRNGTVNVVRTTTLAGYHEGIEHYVTSFEFAGTGGAFGSIVPLPGVPSEVERGGDWTLQRLVREVNPVEEFVTADAVTMRAASAPAEVLMEKRVDALDLTVLKGGAQAVGQWAADNGFNLSPDSPEVLDFYATRSPIFLAARFDAAAAAEKGLALGEGTPVHITIPTPNPWVPLRILALGRLPAERIDADVFLLTTGLPTLLPGDNAQGMEVRSQAPASDSLLADLRSDKGMSWVPESMQLTHIRIDAAPDELDYDLAVDASGAGQPSRMAAGFLPTGASTQPGGGPDTLVVIGVGAGLVALVAAGVVVAGRRASRTSAVLPAPGGRSGPA